MCKQWRLWHNIGTVHFKSDLEENTNTTLESHALSREGGGRPTFHLEKVSKLFFGGFKLQFEEVRPRPHPSLLAILSDD